MVCEKCRSDEPNLWHLPNLLDSLRICMQCRDQLESLVDLVPSARFNSGQYRTIYKLWRALPREALDKIGVSKP